MADYGRIQAVVIATVSGNVVYERFYNAFTDLDKAALRASLQQVTCAAAHHVHAAEWDNPCAASPFLCDVSMRACSSCCLVVLVWQCRVHRLTSSRKFASYDGGVRSYRVQALDPVES